MSTSSSSQISVQCEREKRVRWDDNVLDSSIESTDDEMIHVIGLLKAEDVLPFIRWADVSSSIHFRDSAGNSVIHWAAALGNMKVVTHLIFLGADLDSRNHKGASPLHCAIVAGHHAVAVQLLRHGANATCKNNRGQTFFDLLQLTGRKQLVCHYEHLKEILLFVENSQCDDSPTTQTINFTHKGLIGSLGLLHTDVERTKYQSLKSDDSDLPTRKTNGLSSNLPSVNGQQAMWSKEVELICALEAAERNALTSACWENLLSLLVRLERFIISQSCFCSSIAELSKRVTVVLGEKYSGDENQLMLLVGLEGQPEGAELWVAASRVAESHVVKDYMKRFECVCAPLGSTCDETDADFFGADSFVEESKREVRSQEPLRSSFEETLRFTSTQPGVKKLSDYAMRPRSSDVADGCRMNVRRLSDAAVQESTPHKSCADDAIQRQLSRGKSDKLCVDAGSQETPRINYGRASRNPPDTERDDVSFLKETTIESGILNTAKSPKVAKSNVKNKVQLQHQNFNSVEERKAYDDFLYKSALRRLNVQKKQ